AESAAAPPAPRALRAGARARPDARGKRAPRNLLPALQAPSSERARARWSPRFQPRRPPGVRHRAARLPRSAGRATRRLRRRSATARRALPLLPALAQQALRQFVRAGARPLRRLA